MPPAKLRPNPPQWTEEHAVSPRMKNALGLVGIVCLVAATCLAGWMLAPMFEHVPLDATTGCLRHQPLAAHTVILVDETDPLSEGQARRLRAVLDRTAQSVVLHERLTILLLDPASPYEPRRIFSMCAPRNPQQERYVDGNQRLAQKRWDDAFGKPLNDAIAQLMLVPSSPQSPIVEALKGITWLEDFGPDLARRRLILFSDMLQNTEGLSHYRGRPDFVRWSATEHASRHRIQFTNVEVRIEYLQRPETLRLQTEDHRRFWADFFEAAGAHSSFADGLWPETPPSPTPSGRIVQSERIPSRLPLRRVQETRP
jgi:hypothetical protein